MKYYAISQYAFITIVTLVLSACQSGAGQDAIADISGKAISLTITSPANGEYYETPDHKVSLAGTAGSDMDIVSVSWANDRGWQGKANGTEIWKTGSIPLELGENAITVIAFSSKAK